MVRAPYLPRTGETLIGDAWWWKQGGKGGNQAMAAARHGAAVRMIGCLGDDEFGARLRERLAAAGVDLADVRHGGAGLGHERGHPAGRTATTRPSSSPAPTATSTRRRSTPARRPSATAACLLLQNEIAEAANAAAAATRPRAPA